MSLEDLPPIREVVNSFDLGAKKALGQHFLMDLNITRKIARLANADPSDIFIEVGPGPGGLTRALLETGARVIAIEQDKRCIAALQETATASDGKLQLVEADALATRELDLIPGKTVRDTIRIASNLPYNISTELLIKWLKQRPCWWSSMTLMFQKEVGDRILAAHGSKVYGRLSVLTQAIAMPQKGFTLPARAFTPPPKVDSIVLHIEPKSELDFDITALETLTAAAFSQRRKMLRSSLKPLLGEKTESTLASVGLSPTLRAEQVSVLQFIELTKVYPTV